MDMINRHLSGGRDLAASYAVRVIGILESRQQSQSQRGSMKQIPVSALSFPVEQFQSRLLDWAPIGFQQFPWRKKMPLWKGLMVEMMLQRTKASQVVPVFMEFDRRFPTAKSLCSLNLAGAEELLRPLGLAWRVPLFVDFAQIVADRKGHFSKDPGVLEELPGVGHYAAAAALSLYSGVKASIVDSNVVRVLCRVAGIKYDAETRRKKWLLELADEVTPADKYRTFNYGVLDLSMQICTRTKPRCAECPLQDICATASVTKVVDSA